MSSATINIVSKVTGLPLAGLAGTLVGAAWRWTAGGFVAATAPTFAEGADAGVYTVTYDATLETSGGIIRVTTGQEPAFWLLSVYKADNSNQLLEALFVDVHADGTLTLCPTADLPTVVTSWSRAPEPSLYVVSDGIVAVKPSSADIAALATGTLNAPVGFEPTEWTLETVAQTLPDSGGGGLTGAGGFIRTTFVRRKFKTRG